MNEELKLINNLIESLDLLLNGDNSVPVIIPENYPDNEIKTLAIKVNEIIDKISLCTDSLLSISNGDPANYIPQSRMKIHEALNKLQSNLNHLTWKTQRIAMGDFNQTIDFMGEFSNAFNSMTMQLKQAFDTIEKQNNMLLKKDKEMTRDLKLAAAIQKTLISDAGNVHGIKIHTIYKPMILIGGDFYTFVEFTGENKFGIFIADVNGHGVNAALVTGILKVLIDSAGDIRHNPSGFLYYINSRIIDLGLDIYFTALYGICDKDKKELIYARGGHNNPFLIKNNREIHVLESDGPLLGASKDIKIENRSSSLNSGDKIILYTDGLTETENLDGIAFEENALQNVLKKNSDMNIKDLINTLYAELIYYRGSEKFDDDICILGIELL